MSEVHYYSNYTDSHDIDCFFRIGDTAYHFASNGQPIPSFITRTKNIAVQDAVYERLGNANGDVDIRKDVIRVLILKELGAIDRVTNERRIENEELDGLIDGYASTFVEMAKLGFISMDLDEDGVFHIIASPKDQHLFEDIMRLLPVVRDGEVRIQSE